MKIPFYRSIFTKIILTIFVSFLVILTGGFLLLYANVRDLLKERTDQEKIQSFQQLEQNIDSFEREVEFLTERLINDTTLKELIITGNKKVSEEIIMRADYFREVAIILAGYPYVESICLFNSEDVALITDEKRNIILYEEDSKGFFYEAQLSAKKADVERRIKWYGGYQSTDFAIPLSKYEEPTAYITACRPVYWSAHKAWIVINVELSYFTGIYNSQEKRNVQPETVYILDGKGMIISHPQQSEIGKTKGEEFQKEDQSEHWTFEDEQNQILCYPLNVEDWILVGEIPLSVIWKDSNRMQEVFLAIVIVVIFLCLLLVIFWVRRIGRPLKETVEALKRMEDGTFGITIPQREMDKSEIGLLVRQFNRMSNKIEELLEENAQMEQNKRETEIKMLKSQISPHFLYNTLNTVKWMAAVKGEEDIVDCVSALGDLIQPLFRDIRSFWSLQEEQVYIMNYNKIMNYRYGGKVILSMEIEEELKNALIPKFVLQPLVENAFVHAAPERETPVNVCIRGQRETKEELVLEISDNGEGMDKEELAQLRAGLNTSKETAHIGLVNVHQRLVLLYGEPFGLSIDSRKGEGFSVKVRISLHEK